MKKIGLIGGMSWVSTVDYYRYINTLVQERLGGLSSAEIMLESLNFSPIAALQSADDWPALDSILAESAKRLEQAGADCVLICANTMHKCAPAVEAAIDIPLIHIADATAQAIKADGMTKVALLGTRYTMELPFLRDRMAANGLDVIVPNDAQRTTIHDIIYGELVKNIFTDDSRSAYIDIMQALQSDGSEAMVLACTEIPMLVTNEHTDIPLFDPTFIHAQAAVDFALQD